MNVRATMASPPRLVGFAIAAVILATTIPPQRHAAADEAMPARDAATEALLEQLQQREMPDVMLWVLERVAADPQASAALKRTVPFRKASALVGTTRSESNSEKRAKILDEAEREIDAFLATGPEGRVAIDAYSQKANLLIQRGRAKVDQSKRPGQDVAALRGQAIAFFETAIKALQGTVKPGQPVEKVTNAEDAVIKALRGVDAKIAALTDDGGDQKADEGTDKKPAKPKPKPKRSRAEEKQLELLEEEQEFLRTKLIQTRLMTAETYFEKSKAYEPKSQEWTTALEESAKRHMELADKYATMGAGLFARYYGGRNYALLGKREQALATLAASTASNHRSH